MDIDKIKAQAKQILEEKPLEAVVAVAGVATAISAIANNVSAARSRNAYARQVNHSIKMQSKKKK
jgi:hypothetical protein